MRENDAARRTAADHIRSPERPRPENHRGNYPLCSDRHERVTTHKKGSNCENDRYCRRPQLAARDTATVPDSRERSYRPRIVSAAAQCSVHVRLNVGDSQYELSVFWLTRSEERR